MVVCVRPIAEPCDTTKTTSNSRSSSSSRSGSKEWYYLWKYDVVVVVQLVTFTGSSLIVVGSFAEIVALIFPLLNFCIAVDFAFAF